MNRQEIAEIRRRLVMDKNAISCVRGCYVNEKREIVSTFDRSLMEFPQEEAEKYLSLFKKTLSGIPGRNLIDVEFSPDQVMEGEAHGLLMALKNTQLKVDEGVNRLCDRIIENLEMEGNYLILMMHDAYDVPFRHADEHKVDVISEEVFDYIIACVCPVKLSKPGLCYFSDDNDFHSCEQDWVVSGPEVGFMFPTFDDRATNIYGALYYTKDAGNLHEEFIDAVFNAEAPMPADTQRETFQTILEEALEDELSFDVVSTVHDTLSRRLEENDKDKAAEPLEITRREVVSLLEDCGVGEEKLQAFARKYDEQFGEAVSLPARNVVEPKKLELKTADVVIHVSPDRSDLVETRVIDGVKYILIRAEEGVEVNGLNVTISQS